MNITIKKLTPELCADYFDFFDNRAFSDRGGAYCYCTWFHVTCTVEEHYGAGRDAMKANAAAMIKSGRLNGYLAYDGGIAVGWCNADDRAVYARLPDCCEEGEGRVKSIVCFEIAPEYRGKGIASALLEQVIADAKDEGYTVVEAYPKLRETPDPYDYAGPIRMYEKAGFAIMRERGGDVVMRKTL